MIMICILDHCLEPLCPSTQQSGAAREATQSLEGGEVSVAGFVLVRVVCRTTIADQIDGVTFRGVDQRAGPYYRSKAIFVLCD